MAGGGEDQWDVNLEDVNEENMLLGGVGVGAVAGSEMIRIQNEEIQYDQEDSSSATSYTASVTNSPMAPNRGVDSHLEQRRLSIDQLTEEAEADLANNNDPNNNSSNNEENQIDQHLQHEQQQQQQQQEEIQNSRQRNFGRMASYSDDDESDEETSSEYPKPNSEILPVDLEPDISLILKLMPDKAYDEVRFMLEAHQNDPSRVQIVLNEFLEQNEDPENMQKVPREPSPVPTKNKAGNGMVCKNRKGKKSSTATSSATVPDGSIAGPSSLGIWNDLNDVDLTLEKPDALSSTSRKRRKTPLLDLNLDDDDHINDETEPSTSSGTGTTVTPNKRSKLDIMSALTDVENEVDSNLLKEMEKDLDPDSSRPSSTSTTNSSSFVKESSSSISGSNRRKIQLSEDHLHGPFNFMDHRPRKDQKSSNKRSDKDHKSSNSSSVSSSGNIKTTPTLVDLSNETNSPPPVVDLSQSDTQEVRDLYQSLTSMFPETVTEYLEEQAEELAGKPAALERFITEHLARNSEPPDYWQPKVQSVTTKIEPNSDVIENAGVLNLSREDQGTNMTMDAMDNDDDEVDNIPNILPPRPPTPTEFTPDLTVDLPTPPMDVSEMKDIQFGTDPQPGTSQNTPIVQQNNPNNETIDLTDGIELEPEPGPSCSNSNQVDSEEDRANRRLETLVTLFPQVDPEFLHAKAVEFGENEGQMNTWVQQTLDQNLANDFPKRSDYEKRQREAEMLEKYSGQVTVQEILDMYDDPEAYFMDKTRKVSELYKKHSMNQLKKEFRQISVAVINKVFTSNNGLFVPCVRALKKHTGGKRKTRRPDHECPMPTEIDINFLKELQYSRKEEEMKEFLNEKNSDMARKIEEARERGTLVECVCCYSDECLVEDMLPCESGHLFCKDCVQRASEVAIGDGKIHLNCLGHCDEEFALATLQKALKANTFSKWLRRIQIAEIEKADVDGLEQCPFCNFANIMESTPDENKIFKCQNPDCGKESCRLCKEISHIPLRCEEVEKDAEVRKRTYIENKMTEAMIRKCWKCSKPFVKMDGCNKMTCDCGASMCYLCRQPVKDYKHFYGQGGVPQPGQQCPLWSDNSQIHESDVARGAIEAKNEMDRENPDVQLKHDPAKDINLAAGNAPPNVGGPGQPPGGYYQGMPMPGHPVHGPMGPMMARVVPDVPPGLEGVLPADPMERIRMVREQERLEAMIRGHRGGGPPGHHHHAPHPHPFNWVAGGHIARPIPVNNHPAAPGHQRDFIDRMGELLQLREVQRQRNRAIRRREQQALEEFNIHRIGAHPERHHNARGGAEAPPPPGAPGAPGPQGAVAAAAGGGPLPPQPPPPPYALHPPPQPPRPVINVNPIPPAHNVQPAPPLPPPPQAHGGREALPPQAHQPRGPPYHGWVNGYQPAAPPPQVNPWGRRGVFGFADAPPAAAPVPPAGRLGRAAQGGPFQIRIEQRQQQQPPPPPPPQRRPGEFQGPPPQPPVTQAQQQPPQQRQQQQRVDLRAPILRLNNEGGERWRIRRHAGHNIPAGPPPPQPALPQAAAARAARNAGNNPAAQVQQQQQQQQVQQAGGARAAQNPRAQRDELPFGLDDIDDLVMDWVLDARDEPVEFEP